MVADRECHTNIVRTGRLNERSAGVESDDALHASETLEEIQGEWALQALARARGSVEAARDAR